MAALVLGVGLFVPSPGAPDAPDVISEAASRCGGEAEESDLGGTPACVVEVTFDSEGLSLAGQWLTPLGAGPFPAAVLIRGSGESARGNEWTETLAGVLVAEGLGVLIPDKRGSDRSEGDWRTADFSDLAEDALSGVRYLASRTDVVPERIGLMGLSQGGMIAPVAASRSDSAAFVINVVGSGVPLLESVRFEMLHTFREQGLAGPRLDTAMTMIDTAVGHILGRVSWDAYLQALRGRRPVIGDEIADEYFISTPEHWRWGFFRRLVDFDSVEWWEKVEQPSLVLLGEEDTNTPTPESARRIRAAFAAGAHPASRVVVFEGLGHALWDISGPPSEHGLDARVRRTLASWVRDVVVRDADATRSGGALADAEQLARWLALPAPPGHERLATDPLLQRLDGWRRDGSGNLTLERGEGSPTRVVACGIDRPGYVVSRVTDDGYLRLHTVGRTPDHPLWHGFHEGQQVRVYTADGAVPGVAAIANAHFAFQHRGDTALVTADDLWVDVGAESRADVEAMGIRLLDPVARRLPPWSYGDVATGPGAGARAGCAALAAVAGSGGGPASGRTVFVMSAQRSLGWVGLGAAVARLGAVDDLTLLVPAGDTAVDGRVPVAATGGLAPVLAAAGLDSLRRLAPAVRFPETLVESVRAAEAARLRARVAEVAGMPAAADAGWPDPGVGAGDVATAPAPERDPSAGRGEAVDWAALAEAAAGAGTADPAPLATLLGRLSELPGVSGHEAPVREAVLAALPAWARERAEVDSAGNVVVAFGPERDTTAFLAHLDEVGWEASAVEADGAVSLRPRGGFYDRAWEGQPAVLHPAAGGEPLRGVFVPRPEAREREVEELRAWFGRDSAALAARGVRAGDPVVGHKEALRLGLFRLTARAEDDRAGTTALLLALRGIDPDAVPGKVVFAWTVREEVGLEGARVLAGRLGRSTTRVYSVDTFVSSDTPLESKHFAYAPLGRGPVLRAVESSSLAPPDERRRVRAVARAAEVPLQVGLTQGGTDGTAFTFWGAPNAGLSWPGRYSHSPVEVLDLRDVARLVELVRAVATAGPEVETSGESAPR